MTFQAKHRKLLETEDIRRWHNNLRKKSSLSADVMLRNLGLYCELCHTDPIKLLESTKDRSLRDQFDDFVTRLEKQGKAGSYISKFKFALLSWLRFNDIDYKLNVEILNADQNPTVENERVPTKDELTKIIREGSKRARVSIALMAFSGLRPESLGNYEGTDGLMLSDIPDLNIHDHEVSFEHIPAHVIVRKELSKARITYNTFIGAEGCNLISEYLSDRISQGEVLNGESPLIKLTDQNFKRHDRMRTLLVTRDIREAVTKSGNKFRPYVLRAYFATAMDISESKGLISHAWRQHFMGHKNDIEATYSTNKKLLPEVIDEMRKAYEKCLPYVETREVIGEDQIEKAKSDFKREYLRLFFTDEQIDQENLMDLDATEMQDRIKKHTGMVMNGHKQKVISQREVKHYIEDLGWEYVKDYGKNEAIMRLPD